MTWTSNPLVVDVADVIRIVCIILASIALGYLAAAVGQVRQLAFRVPPPNWVPLAGALLFLLIGGGLLVTSALFTEVGRMGTEVTWRLPVNVLGITLELAGAMLTQVRTSEHPPPAGSPWSWVWHWGRGGR